MSDAQTAGDEAQPTDTDEPGLADAPDEGASEDSYFLQVFLTRGQPDDPTNPQPPDDAMEVAADAWQFEATGDDEATLLAMDTLMSEYGNGGSDAEGQAVPARSGQQQVQQPQQPQPGQQGAGQQQPQQGQGQARQAAQPAMSGPGQGAGSSPPGQEPSR